MTKLKSLIYLLLLAYLATACGENTKVEAQANVLYILTDDHRYDAVRAFNKMLTGEEMSELGYVESPETDRLTQMGTTFINTYCQAQGCAPSRSSMHLGRYPFRSGVYEFEYYNNKAEHSKPTLPEQMADLGYQTLHVGKLGVRIKTLNEEGQVKPHNIYQQDIYFKDLAKAGLTAWGKDLIYEVKGHKFNPPLKNVPFFVTEDGEFEYCSYKIEELGLQEKGVADATMKKYDLWRFGKPGNPSTPEGGMIISGVSPRPAGKTRDGYYASSFVKYLENANQPFTLGGKLTFNGIDTSKPLFCHIGFDFPHTPVLPPADYRERFQKHTYKVPEMTQEEYDNMSKQMKTQVKKNFMDSYSDAEKQKMIQDYYAFCAYGDRLVGQAADAFIKYSEENNQEWMIIYVHGDHGWKLNDHGAISKFTPWEEDTHNPIIVVSSDKKKFPAGKVVRNFTEFVDVAPTALAAAGANLNTEKFDYLDGLDLAQVASGKAPVRDYVIGESHAVTGPRAYIRTKDYVFSMQTRPNNKRGVDMDWALNASYKDLDPALYHFTEDPGEVNNLAFNKEYEAIAMKMKDKLMNIVLGDNRVEVGWGKRADGTEVFRSNFAPGAHDYKLDLD